MKRLTCLFLAWILLVAADRAAADTFGSGANTFDIEFVTIGNLGNAADTTGSPNPAGSVPYTYRMGTFEISEQMIEKANALGGLGITKDTRGADKPATSVSWNEAARFVNWLNTSTGNMPAYKFAIQPGEAGYIANANIELWMSGDAGYDPDNLYRNSLARFFLPSVDEWYKAAYYDPTSGVYYDYPTGSDSVPDGIDLVGDLLFDAVFNDGASGSPNDITNVGLLSPYGTAGQGGNVWELEETDFVDLVNGPSSSARVVRGGGLVNGSIFSPVDTLLSSNWVSFSPGVGVLNVGFRVASIAVPEPSTLLLLCFGSLAVLRRRLPGFASTRCRKHAQFHQQAPMFHALGKVDSQDVDRRATDGRESPQVGTVPRELRVPIVAAGMKERRQVTGIGIVTRDVDRLERIAIKTTDAQVLGDGGTMMVLRADMIDGKRQRIELTGHPAILTRAAGARPHKLAQFAVDGRHYSGACGLSRASRARACRMPSSVPTRRKLSISARSESVSKPWLLRSISSRIRSWSSRAKASDAIASAFSGERTSRSRIADSWTTSVDMPLSYRAGESKTRAALIGRLTRNYGLFCASILAVAVGIVLPGNAHADTFGSGENTFDVEFVTIGNPGNAADTTGNPNPAGAVSYTFRMGKFEISEQMIDKANDEGGLGITKDIRGADKPATSVSWNEAARFVNWLNTTSGSTPAYTFALQPGDVGYSANTNIELWTIGDAGYNPNNLYRNSLARLFLPSVDEWYKAAYYDPTSGVYYDYPSGSDTAPTAVASGTAPGTAVFNLQLGPADITLAGGLSPYGTMGQGGNVWEWDETELDLENDSSSSRRGLRGGSWQLNSNGLLASTRANVNPTDQGFTFGFRVASLAIPEPSTLLLAVCGAVGALVTRRRRQQRDEVTSPTSSQRKVFDDLVTFVRS